MDIGKTITILLRMAVSADYRFVRRKKIFDPGYYLATFPNGEAADSLERLDPLWHFLKISGNDYLPELSAAGGWCHFASPHPLFDIAFYLLRYFPDGLGGNPFVHYLRQGWRDGLRSGPYFEPKTYQDRSAWTVKDGDPLTHFTHIGSRQGVSPGENFDIAWYHDRNPVLADVRQDIIKHYKLHGGTIGKSPLPVFEPGYYRTQAENSPTQKPLPDPLAHFITTGAERGLRPSPWFDPATYLANSGVQCGLAEALADYVHRGVVQGYITDPRIAQLTKQPVVSLLVPVYNPDIGDLNNCIRSVLYQAYPYWQLCLADDCSTATGVRETLEAWAARDRRIRVVFHQENQGISGATNSAAALAEGDYVGFLDNDDELTVDCLYKIVKAVNTTGADLLYSDEDLIGDDGTRLSVFRKPDYNAALLLSHNYITHFVVAARQLFQDVGGFSSACDGAQDYDMMLKLSEVAARIHHIPEVLYHWRASDTSTSINHNQKNYAHDAGKLALGAALQRRGLAGTVADTGLNFFYRLQPDADTVIAATLVVVIFKHQDTDRENTLSSLWKTLPAHCSVAILYPDNEGTANIAPGKEAGNIRWHAYDPQRGFAAVCNAVAAETEAGFLAFVTGDGVTFREGWLLQLQVVLAGKQADMVCGRVFVNGGDGPSYSLPDTDNDSPHYLHEFLHQASRHLNGLHCLQQVGCCSWEMTMMPKTLFADHGGFDIQVFPQLFGMADFARRVISKGGNIVYTPDACLESITEESRENPDWKSGPELLKTEKQAFQQRWQQWLQGFDPMYNVEVLADNGLELNVFRRWLVGQTLAAGE